MIKDKIQLKNWRKVRLDEIGLFRGGVTSIKPDDYGFGTPFITYMNVFKNSKININNLELMNVPKKDVERLGCVYGDIFFTASSETYKEIGMSSVLLNDIKNLTFNGFCKRFRLNNFNTLLPIYARYLFRSPALRYSLISKGTGDIRFNISQQSLGEIEILVPDTNTQKRIAKILSAFDEKVELNNKINQNLEQTAEAIFKEWFVKFKLPGRRKVKMIDSDLGKIPEGWNIRNVSDILERLPQGKTYTPEQIQQKGFVAVYSQSSGMILGYHNESPAFSATIDKPVILFGDHTCRMNVVTIPCSLGPNIVPFIGNIFPTIFVYFITKGKISQREYKRHWAEFEQQKIVVPTPDLAEEYVKIVKPIISKMAIIENENQKLASLRDLLLPRLMSGEIRV